MINHSSYFNILKLVVIPLVLILDGCLKVESFQASSSIIGNQVTEYLPTKYAIEYLMTIRGNCFFDQDGVQLMKNGKRSNLIPYNMLTIYPIYKPAIVHYYLRSNDGYQWMQENGEESYLILYDSREKQFITSAEESVNNELIGLLIIAPIANLSMQTGDPYHLRGKGSGPALLGLAISQGLPACAIEFANENKIMTALASLGVR